MIKELIVHLGDTKTGSTTLQGVLKEEAYRLPEGKSLLYPGKGLNHNHLPRSLSHKKEAERADHRFKGIFRAFKGSDDDFAVVSAENFQGVDPERLQEKIAAHWPGLEDRMRLISYVRPHAEKLLSSFAEQTKFGRAPGGVQQFYKQMSRHGTLDYVPRFRKWKAVFGERFELRPFVRSELYQQDVVQDFFQFLLRGPGAQIQDIAVANTSPSVAQIALLRKVHEAFLGDRDRSAGPRELAVLGRLLFAEFRKVGLGSDSGKLLIPSPMMGEFTKRYREDAATLDAEFFAGTPMSDALRAAPEKLSGPLQPLKAEAYFSEETIRAIEVLSSLLGQLGEHDSKTFYGLARGLLDTQRHKI